MAVRKFGPLEYAAAPQATNPVPLEVLERRYRPLVGGIKIGNVKNDFHRFATQENPDAVGEALGPSYGTLACFARTANGKICALTNQHVVNRKHLGSDGRLPSPETIPGREVFQPAPMVGEETGRPKKDADTEKECWCGCKRQQEELRIGRVLLAKNSSKVDGALIALRGGIQFRQQVLSRGAPGTPGVTIPLNGSRKKASPDAKVYVVGEPVLKFGFLTGTTTGKISTLKIDVDNDAVDADFGVLRSAPTESFIVESTDPNNPFFADLGDSGSVVIGANDHKVIGLLWGRRRILQNGKHVASHGLIDPIDLVEQELGCEIFPFDPGSPTQTVPSNNLDGVPHVDENGKEVKDASPERLAREVLAKLRARSRGDELAAIAERNALEVIRLLHEDARLRAVWVRNGGPAIAGTFLHEMIDFDNRLPSRVWGQPLAQCVDKIGAELFRAGSSELQASLRVAVPIIKLGQDATFGDVVRQWEESL